MLFKSLAQLKSSLLGVADSVTAFWCSNRPPGASLQPQVCMLAPTPNPSAGLCSFLSCLLSPSGFLFSFVLRSRLLF